MSVWFCIPSARPPAEAEKCLARWRERGCKVALWLDSCDMTPWYTRPDGTFGSAEGLQLTTCSGGKQWIFSESFLGPRGASMIHVGAYPGYALAVNSLALAVLRFDPECQWVCTGGDDVYPDPNKTADEIAAECSEHFAGIHAGVGLIREGKWRCRTDAEKLATFGVMQPTGDPYGENDAFAQKFPIGRRRYIERICGSPWLGREWCLRGNQGHGPFHPGFWHMHGDECLQEVAEKLGILWQRPDLCHHHEHWARKRSNTADMPAFLARANSREHWEESKALLNKLRADGFRECMPL
jgi:hypothetical protein